MIITYLNKNHFSKCNILGSSLIIVIGIILLVTTIVVMGLNRQLTAKKLSRTDRLISEEFEIKRTLINLITQKYGYYVFDGNDIDALITSCDKDLALFKFWYSDSYHGVSYRVSACDNKDNLPSYTQDQDGFLWFKVDVDYGDGRKKPFHALIGPSIVAIPTPTPSPTPSPTSGPTSTRTPSPTPTFAPECLEDFKTVPCPSPTPCVDAKGLPIPCPSSTPCEAIDFLGVLGVPGATVTVRCRTCTDKFSNPTACPSPTITPPPSPTPTPTATPTPTGTPTSTPTATPTPSPTPTPEETPTPEPSPTPDQCTSYAVLGIHAYQFPDGTTNPGSGNPSGVSACGHSITGLMSRTGNNITLTCYHNGTIVASQVVAVTSSVGFFSIGRSIHGLPEGGAVHYVKCDIMGTEVFRLYIN